MWKKSSNSEMAENKSDQDLSFFAHEYHTLKGQWNLRAIFNIIFHCEWQVL